MQGLPGSYSSLSFAQLGFVDVSISHFHSPVELRAAFQSDSSVFCWLPIWNSIVGDVTWSVDLISEFGLSGDFSLLFPIEHCLVAHPGSSLSDITEVVSHPVALAQCKQFFSEHNLRTIPGGDTVGCLSDLLSYQAGLCSSAAASLYGLDVISRNVADHPHNFTLFGLFSCGV